MPLTPPPQSISHTQNSVQVIFGGKLVATSEDPILAWFETNKPPRYLLPFTSLIESSDIRFEPAEQVNDDSGTSEGEQKQDWIQLNLRRLEVGGKSTTLSHYRSGSVKGYLGFQFYEQDAWIENGALRSIPPKNPAKRIDTATRAGSYIITVGGKKVAEAREAVALYETGRPVKYYLPANSVIEWAALRKNEVRTACPYKGEAWYFDIELDGKKYANAIWYYPYPIAESAAVAGRFAFDSSQDGVALEVNFHA